MDASTTSRPPSLFIPTLYFASGLPYVIINNVSTIFYKKLAIDNAQITLWTSFLYLPWVIKMFWGPVVDLNSTKRTWILATQFAMFFCLALIALSLQLPNFFFNSLAILTVGAFISATYDIATDGFYLLALNPPQQALFVGIRSLCYRLAVIFGSGILVILAGQLETYLKNIPLSWTLALAFCAIIFAVLFIYHRFILPFPESNNSTEGQVSREEVPFLTIFISYFQQYKIGAILAFILLYRLGEAMLLKLASLFLLDKPNLGGLGLSTTEVGLVYGTSGVIALILGGILGGVVIAKYGLKKCLWPMALAMNLPNAFYVYMAYSKPAISFVYLLVAVEQFGYGFGFTAFSVYLMYICQGEFKTSHYAISTGFMALGMMFPGILSGYIQQQVGYLAFFIWVCVLTVPGMIAMLFIPLNHEGTKDAKKYFNHEGTKDAKKYFNHEGAKDAKK